MQKQKLPGMCEWLCQRCAHKCACVCVRFVHAQTSPPHVLTDGGPTCVPTTRRRAAELQHNYSIERGSKQDTMCPDDLGALVDEVLASLAHADDGSSVGAAGQP